MVPRHYLLLSILTFFFSLSLLSSVVAFPSTGLDAIPQELPLPTVSDNVDDELVLKILQLLKDTPDSQAYNVNAILAKVDLALRSATRPVLALAPLRSPQVTRPDAFVANPLDAFTNIIFEPFVQCTTVKPSERNVSGGNASSQCVSESPFSALFARKSATYSAMYMPLK
jgi:hypothetical protein